MSEEYLVLARKYRPNSFAHLKGQDFLVQTIVNAMKLNRVPHTYLFTGIRGSGKTTTARIIAKTLNCENPVFENEIIIPCQQCSNCLAYNKHPDVIELDAASRTGVDDIRNIIENANYLPLQGKFKIFIIDEVHMLSTAAFNSLLKTLEEPPAHVKFIFATTELRKIPITILSRCQKFELRRLRPIELIHHLKDIAQKENVQIDDVALKLLASHAEGSVRDALSLFDMIIARANGEAINHNITREVLGIHNSQQGIDLFEAIICGKVLEALNIVKELYYSGKDLMQMLQHLMELVHQISKLKLGVNEKDTNFADEDIKRLSCFVEKLDISSLTIVWQMLQKGSQELQFASNQLLSAEMLMIRLCHLSNIPTPAAIIEKFSEKEQVINTQAIETKRNSFSIKNFEEMVQLFHHNREMLLYHYLVHDINLVEFTPLKVKIKQNKNVPQNIALKMMDLLYEWTGEKWLIVVSSDEGKPTLSSQAEIEKLEKLEKIAQNDLVQEVLQNFASAKLVDSVGE